MEHTRPILAAADFSKTMQGYDLNNKPMPFVNLQGYYLGPSLNSTLNDLLTFMTAQLSAKDEAMRLTHQYTWGNPTGFALGLGWMMDTANGQRYFYHDGNTKIGFNTLCTFYPESNVGIVILANDVHDLKKLGELENYIGPKPGK